MTGIVFGGDNVIRKTIFFVLLFATQIFAATPTITWELPTPTNGATVDVSSVTLNTTIVSGSSNTSALFDWNYSLRGYWPMDYYNGSGVYDNSTYNRIGNWSSSLTAANFETGQQGLALKFDGGYTNQGVTIPKNLLPNTASYSIIGWVYPRGENDVEGSAKDEQMMVDLRGQYQTFVEWIENDSTVNRSSIRFMGYDGDSINAYSTNNSVPAGIWTHFAAIYNGTHLKLYINGTLHTSLAQGNPVAVANTNSRLGSISDGTDRAWLNGSLDEIAIYSRAISEQEINASFNNSAYRLSNTFSSLAYGVYNYGAIAIDKTGNTTTSYRTVTLGAVQNCTNITVNVNMTNDIYSTGTCFNFTVDNTTLDCKGYSITGNMSTSQFGILASGVKNVTIKNCLVSNYTTGINLTGTNSSFLYNNTVYNTTGSAGAAGTTGAACTVGTAGSSVYGFHFSNSVNNTVQNNTVSNVTGGNGGNGGSDTNSAGCAGGAGAAGYGFNFASSSVNSSFYNNTLTRLNGGNGGSGGNATIGGNGGAGAAGGASYPIYISDSGSSNNTFLLTTVGISSGGAGGVGGNFGTSLFNDGGVGGSGGDIEGVRLSSPTNTITGLIYNLTGGNGGNSGAGGEEAGGTSGGSGGYAYGLYSTATNANQTLENITATNFTGGSGGSPGNAWDTTNYGRSGNSVGAYLSTRYGTLKNFSLTNFSVGHAFRGTPLGSGVYIVGAAATDHLLVNGSISQANNYDVYLNTSAQNNTFLNVSFNKDKVGFGTCTTQCNLTIKWYARVNVTDYTGSALQNAIVNITDFRNNQRMVNNLTAVTGLTNYVIVTEMIMNKTGAVVSNYTFNNHTISVNLSGYNANTTSFNWTSGDITLNVTLYTSGGPTSSCTYSGSGNWIINTADRCNITSSQYLSSNTLTISGSTGYVTFGNPTGATLIVTVQKFIWSGTGTAYMWFKNSTWFNGTM
jgi:hypothetical protein